MSMHVEVCFTNSENGRVIRYEADLDELEVTESHISGELRITPGEPSRTPAVRGDKMPRSKSPWKQYLEGDWEAKHA